MSIYEMSNGERDDLFHHTWVRSLIDTGHKELAALVIDGSLDINHGRWGVWVNVNLPADAVAYFDKDEKAWGTAENILYKFLDKRFYDEEGGFIPLSNIEVSTRIALAPVDLNWRDVARDLIAKSKDLNQGVVTEMVMKRNQKAPIVYNEMKFASNSEVRVAQELERRGILFFPLPLAVRGNTGNMYHDHREVDFLICHHGKWGILEVAYHQGRYEKDTEKAQWFKDAGITCVEHFTAEKAYNSPAEVVTTFIRNLALHK
jgi:hypothetical protein